jgi:peroxiredoxin
MKWWTYHYNDISLSSNFISVNENSETITKDKFLKQLTSGDYIPIEMKPSDSLKTYKLFQLPEDIDNAISTTIQATASATYEFFKMEGLVFPEFDFVGINGKHYNNDSLRGKITVLKTWFISCKPCIEEMPELNDFVKKYEDNDKIQFLSLALDSRLELESFLEKTKFEYAVAPEQKELISKKLKLRAYPTHLIVDENGKIKKVFSKATELISYVEKGEIIITSGSNRLPPPPPPKPLDNSDENDA